MTKTEMKTKILESIYKGQDDQEIARQLHLWTFSTLNQGPSENFVTLISLVRDAVCMYNFVKDPEVGPDTSSPVGSLS